MKILAIGCHPDDVEFGCGGTLLNYSRKNHQVYLMVLTDGSFGADPKLRAQEQEKAAEHIGVKKLFWGEFKDTELPEGRDLITKIERVIKEVEPDIVLLNYHDDVHQDHRAAAHAGISATRYVKEVLFYEVPTTQNFNPDVFVDISPLMEDKLWLLNAHASQVSRTRVENLTIIESAHACATFRGFQGRVRFAEGFKALRILRDIV